MNKITFPRIGVNGKALSKSEIEKKFLVEIKLDIENRLKKEFKNASGIGKDILNWILTNLDSLLIGGPEELDKLRNDFDSKWKGIDKKRDKREKQALGNRIYECFGYEKYRKNFLVKHGGLMNVKCCPYCNQQYTLYIEENERRIDGLARYEYDHFWSKSDYPFLSMSMYNLIPSCPMCNHSKSKGTLPLKFNPYYQEIADMFSYKVKSPARLFFGGTSPDFVTLAMEPEDGVSGDEIEKYDKTFHIKAQAERHKDVVIEAFSRAYMRKCSNECMCGSLIGDDTTLIDRLRYGTYIRKEDIGRRPLTKLYQDIYKQAKGKD